MQSYYRFTVEKRSLLMSQNNKKNKAKKFLINLLLKKIINKKNLAIIQLELKALKN